MRYRESYSMDNIIRVLYYPCIQHDRSSVVVYRPPLSTDIDSKVEEYFTCGCKLRVQNILPAGAKYSGIFYMRVQNIPEYFTCGCKIFRNISHVGAKYSGIFYLQVQNPEYFTCGCKIFRNISQWVQNILPAGAKYSGIFHM